MKTLTLRNWFIAMMIASSITLGTTLGFSQPLKFGNDSTASFQLGFNLQTWASIDMQTSGARFTNSATQGGDWELMIRRARFFGTAIIAKDNYITFHMGVNTIRYNSLQTGSAANNATGGVAVTVPSTGVLFAIHDLSYQRVVRIEKDFELVFGAGVHYYMGPNRFGSGSSTSVIGFDLLANAEPLGSELNVLRAIGVFNAGALGPVNYKWSLNQPYVSAAAVAALTTTAATTTATLNASWVTKELTGYAYYQFFDKESMRTAAASGVGTTLGNTKKFNIGVGGLGVWNNAFTKTGTAAGSGLTYYNTWGISADVYADMPFGEKDALGGITAYAVYTYLNYGPNYARVEGTDNAMLLTGHSISATLLWFTGKLLPINIGIFGEVVAAIPTNDFAGFTNANATAGNAWTRFDVGVSWFAYKSNVRLDLVYRNSSAATTVAGATITTGGTNDLSVRRDRMFLSVRVSF